VPIGEPACDKTAFYRRDYEAAKGNILHLCTRMKQVGPSNPSALSLEEELEILSFFEKYWALFAGEKSSPKCALVQISAIGLLPEDRGPWLALEESFIAERCSSEEDMLSYVFGLQRSMVGNDYQAPGDIPPDAIAAIVTLPDYRTLHG
jgi:hypothetical protein